MKLRPQDLEQNGYILKESLNHHNHEELIPFVQKAMGVTSFWINIYKISIFIIVGLIAFFLTKDFIQYGPSACFAFLYMVSGILITLALIPIHEWIHILSYKIVGAKGASMDVNWKRFYFMALADKFVINRKEFIFVGITPFVLINTTLVISLLLMQGFAIYAIFGTLLIHTAACGGDFALLNYFEFHKHAKMVTYDDKLSGMTYFYVLTPSLS